MDRSTAEEIESLCAESQRICRSYPIEGLEKAQHALDLAHGLASELYTALSEASLAICYLAMRDLKKAEESGNRALKTFESLGDWKRVALTARTLGATYVDLGEFNLAHGHFHRSLQASRREGDDREAAYTLNCLGQFHIRLCAFDTALDYLLWSRRLCSEHTAPALEHSILENLAQVYFSLRRNEPALQYAQEALAIAVASGDRSAEAGTQLMLGLIVNDLGERAAALGHYDRALALFRAIGDRGDEARVLGNMGEIHESGGDLESANDCYRAALQIAVSIGDRNLEAGIRHAIGMLYRLRRRWRDSLRWLQDAMDLAGELGAPGLLYPMHFNLAEVHEERKDFALALHHYKQYVTIRDSVIGEERQQSAANIQHSYELERAEERRSAAELERKRLQALSEELQRKLDAAATKMIMRHDLLDALGTDLSAIGAKAKEEWIRAEIKRIVLSIEDLAKNLEDWEALERTFAQVHQQFKRKLLNLVPKLGDAELRVCMLIRLNMPVEKIAGLLRISKSGVHSHKHNIKSKIIPPIEGSLDNFLRNL